MADTFLICHGGALGLIDLNVMGKCLFSKVKCIIAAYTDDLTVHGFQPEKVIDLIKEHVLVR